MRGIHVATTVGEPGGQMAYGVLVSQRNDDDTVEQIVALSFQTEKDQEAARDQLVALVGRLLP
jgi:hypothetical protein